MLRYHKGMIVELTPEEESARLEEEARFTASLPDRAAVMNTPSVAEILDVVLASLPPSAPIDDIKMRIQAAKDAKTRL